MSNLSSIAQHLLKSHKILVVSHIMPDGDAIGSLLALGLALKKLGKNVTMYVADGVPAKFAFLRGAEEICTSLPFFTFDCVAVLDCADRDRLQPIWEEIKDLFILNLDHHPTNTLFGNLNYVDPQAGATGELVFALLEKLDVKLTLEIATALYVAISTDTGSFKYENTSEKTHLMAAKLLAAGVKPASIAPQIFDLRSVPAIMALRLALSSLQFSADKRIAWMTLKNEALAQINAGNDDLDGIVNFAKNIEGVEVGLLFREQADGTVKVGFRSFNIDVAKIAAAFGGGGHVRAAGCSLQADLQTAVKQVVAAVTKEIEQCMEF
ncbi:MAG: bifunctional oligoribonuclease/PAP phosphatase NrnA [Firmicutes bacterium]|nr:bifunctional oligoribonuclease/PAP phosphatase NrnA [Bacillota bacterium]